MGDTNGARAYVLVGFIVLFAIQLALGWGVVPSVLGSLALMVPVAAVAYVFVSRARDRQEEGREAGPDPYPQQTMWETSRRYLKRHAAWADQQREGRGGFARVHLR